MTAAAISSTPSTSLIHPTTVEGSPSEGWITPDRMTKIVVPTMMPSSQPIRNPVLVRPACGARSMRITAMTGTGLIAMTTA